MAVILSLDGSAQNDALHSLTVINALRSDEIVTLYIWGSGSDRKGENLLEEHLPPDSEITLSIPSGKCNILAFDELGNSYGIPGLIQKNTPDTVFIDLQHITYGRPNIDLGQYLLTLDNSVQGFALDTLIINSITSTEKVIIDYVRLFPEQKAYIWLDKGLYRIVAVDQTGRSYITDTFSMPEDSRSISFTENMILEPARPIGEVGDGASVLIVQNSMPYDRITDFTISSFDDNSAIIGLDSLSVEPGESFIVYLEPGEYWLESVDGSGARYSLSFDLLEEDVLRIHLTYNHLEYDFGFPDRDTER